SLGINHDSLLELNPRLITCSITAYGEHPVHGDRPGYDGLVAARTGLLYDQKGRRGTAMEVINGRPGPYPAFDGPARHHIAAARRPRRVVPQLAAGRAPRCAAVLDVAHRLEVDRGPLRMCG